MSRDFKQVLKECGGLTTVANHFGVTKWAVQKWAVRVPAERCHDLVKLSKGKVKLKDLRPDLWGK